MQDHDIANEQEVLDTEGSADIYDVKYCGERKISEDASFFELLKLNAPMTMLAATLSSILDGSDDMSLERFSVTIHEHGDQKSLQIELNSYDDIEGKRLIEDFMGYLKSYTDKIDSYVDVKVDVMTIVCEDPRALLELFKVFFKEELYDAGHNELQNVDDFCKNYSTEKNPIDWREYGSRNLQQQWIIAALPEKSYGSHEEICAEAFRISVRSHFFTLDQIEAAIEKEEMDESPVQFPAHKSRLLEITWH